MLNEVLEVVVAVDEAATEAAEWYNRADPIERACGATNG
jgi:hypothetical protein